MFRQFNKSKFEKWSEKRIHKYEVLYFHKTPDISRNIFLNMHKELNIFVHLFTVRKLLRYWF